MHRPADRILVGVWSEYYSIRRVVCPPANAQQAVWWHHYLCHSHYRATPDSFCHLRHRNNCPSPRFFRRRLPSSSSSALWLTNDFASSDMVSCRNKRNRNWIWAPGGRLLCHLFNIDVHYVYGLFGCVLSSGPARPVRSATWGSGLLIMSFWLMAFIL